MVVILDILGKDFSDDTAKKRSADNVAGVIALAAALAGRKKASYAEKG